MKEKYIEYAKNTFKGKALDLVLNQIELFYEKQTNINKTKYNLNDYVILKKVHSFMAFLDT